MFEGIWVPMVTPFRDGAVDLPAARRLAQHLCGGGIAGLVLFGTTGEASTVSGVEQQALFHAVREVVPVPIVVGLSGANTAAVASAAKGWQEQGADGLLVTAPYYVRPSQEGIRRHFEAVAAATMLPIILYNIPYRTGVNIEVATVQALAANPQFVAIKESGGGNLEQLVALIEETPLKVLCGEDALIFTAACLGAHGAISAAANVRPDLYVAMLAQINAGNLVEARKLAQVLRPVIRDLFIEPNPAPAKAALALTGVIANELRLPMCTMSAAGEAQLQTTLARLETVVKTVEASCHAPSTAMVAVLA
ncbi:4-hydroxy-tetrahydrodipicolinate synthase [Andreprevotia chitinilytica]|uniref:4-hydroxy-tetrahydrodipicolinate synthase n=1 Tax=Andreprevotia chitinilytica TaxID=396808 RepID=UPI00068E78DC|nr:4-hydroxy-tetrahydrodipicolinate synthase [Andreprevotia chitinilytica]